METKTVYLYDIQRYYAGTHILNERDDKTPVTKEWIIPANSTETPMTLAPKEHYLVQWNGESWAYVEDKNNPPTPEPKPPTPEEEKAQKIAALDGQFEADKKELLMYYVDAMLNGDTAEQEACMADMQALQEQYDSDYQAIIDE